MNNRPSTVRVFGSALVANPFSPQFRPYRYGGDEPFVPAKPINPDAPRCTANECISPPHAKGLCDKHYRRLMAFGDINAPDRRRKENRRAGNGS